MGAKNKMAEIQDGRYSSGLYNKKNGLFYYIGLWMHVDLLLSFFFFFFFLEELSLFC